MKLYEWTNLYEQAVTHAGGDRPGIELEGRIERIGNAYQRGDVKSFWAVLDSDLAAPAGPRFTTTATAKQPSPWKITNEHEDPELPPGPRVLPDFVQAFMHEHWPKPTPYDGEEPPA